MKIFLITILALSLTGCGWFDRTIVASVTGSARTCINGVSYLQFASGVTVEYTPESKVKTC